VIALLMYVIAAAPEMTLEYFDIACGHGAIRVSAGKPGTMKTQERDAKSVARTGGAHPLGQLAIVCLGATRRQQDDHDRRPVPTSRRRPLVHAGVTHQDVHACPAQD